MLVFVRLTAVLIWHGKADRSGKSNWIYSCSVLLKQAKQPECTSGSTLQISARFLCLTRRRIQLCSWKLLCKKRAVHQLRTAVMLCKRRGGIKFISLLICILFSFFFSNLFCFGVFVCLLLNSSRNIFFLINKPCFHCSGNLVFEILLGGNFTLFRRPVQCG